MEHSLPGAKVPGNESSRERKFLGAKVPVTIISIYHTCFCATVSQVLCRSLTLVLWYLPVVLMLIKTSSRPVTPAELFQLKDTAADVASGV